jgi:hypothetical protein
MSGGRYQWIHALPGARVKRRHYKIEYQENGGGTLTTAAVIEFSVEKQNIQRDGKPVAIRALRVSSYDKK